MIQLPAKCLHNITSAAREAYPYESCGLLVGHKYNNNFFSITRTVKTDNVTDYDRRSNFEIDPQMHFDLLRELKNSTLHPILNEQIIGHFHSHPDQPPTPSITDIKMNCDPKLIWIITSNIKNNKFDTLAYIFDTKYQHFKKIMFIIKY